MRITAIAAVLVGALLSAAGCDGVGETPAVSVTTAPSAIPPPVQARLAPAGWPETAAWIARETRGGRPVVVNLFASWCEPCRDELPVLRAAADAHEDVAFLGVAHTDGLEAAGALLSEYGITFPTLFDDIGDVAGALQARGLPVTAFFATDGRLVGLHHGTLTAAELDDRLAALRHAG